MPVYSYKCGKCEIIERHLSEGANCPRCGVEMKRIIGKIPNVQIKETTDNYRNKKNIKGMDDVLKKRSKDYFYSSSLMDEAIEKIRRNFGDKEAINMSKRLGWLDPVPGKKRTKKDLK
jgi:putative FmdB family regulatory protein